MAPDPNSLLLPGPWQHRMVHVHGQRLHVAEIGEATCPLVLFIHGATGGWFEWREVLPLLADAPIHAVAVSMRGYGPSDRTPQGYRPRDAADDISGLIRALGHSSAVLVGQGFGAWVAWTVAAAHPDMTAGIVGCGAVHPRSWATSLKSIHTPSARTALLNAMRLSWQYSPVPVQRTRVRLRRGSKRASKDDVIERLVHTAMMQTGPGFEATAAGQETAHLMELSLSAGALRPALTHIDWVARPLVHTTARWVRSLGRPDAVRTVLLGGEFDLKSPVSLMRASSAQVIVVEGAGHYLPVEAPRSVADAVHTHLDWLPSYPTA